MSHRLILVLGCKSSKDVQDSFPHGQCCAQPGAWKQFCSFKDHVHYQTMGMVLIWMIMVDQINNGQIGRMSSNICSSFICSSFAEVVGNKCGGACGLDKKQPRSASLLWPQTGPTATLWPRSDTILWPQGPKCPSQHWTPLELGCMQWNTTDTNTFAMNTTIQIYVQWIQN